MNYSAALVLEVRQANGGVPYLTFKFKNGTDDDDFNTYGFLGSPLSRVPVSTFVNAMEVRITFLEIELSAI